MARSSTSTRIQHPQPTFGELPVGWLQEFSYQLPSHPLRCRIMQRPIHCDTMQSIKERRRSVRQDRNTTLQEILIPCALEPSSETVCRLFARLCSIDSASRVLPNAIERS